MSDMLSSQDFTNLLNEKFAIHVESQPVIEVELVEVLENERAKPPQAQRTPFSIVFRGPGEILLPQQMYRLENDKLGKIELFLVPIIPDQNNNFYEAVFN